MIRQYLTEAFESLKLPEERKKVVNQRVEECITILAEDSIKLKIDEINARYVGDDLNAMLYDHDLAMKKLANVIIKEIAYNNKFLIRSNKPLKPVRETLDFVFEQQKSKRRFNKVTANQDPERCWA